MIRIRALLLALPLALIGSLTATIPAQAAALPLPSTNAMYYFDYATSTTPLSQITDSTAGSLTASAVCPSSVCTGTIGTNSGAFIDAATSTMYVASTDVSNSFTLQSVPLTGQSAGVPSLVGTTAIASGIYGIAQGPTGAFGLAASGDLYSINLTNASTARIGYTGLSPDTWNGFAYNQADGNFYAMNRSNGNLYQINVTTPSSNLVGAVPNVGSSYSLQVDSAGTFWNLSGSSELRTFTVSGSTISASTSIGSFSGFTTTAMAVFAPPLTYTVTYQHGTGATGNDLVQTINQGSSITLPSPTACPLSATDPCFTAPTGQRANNWQVTGGTISSGSSYPMTGASITPTSNVTLTARWTGGPVQYSTTSFLSGGTAMSSIAFPNTAVGSSNQITVYAYNSGTASTQISNETVGGAGVSRQGGTCNASGGTITAGAQCTLILQWNPSSAGNLSGGSYQMQVSGSYFDAVTLTGLAATNKTVTFNSNTGTGTLANQVAAFTTNLTQNCVSGTCAITRAGYDFNGWNTQALGGGTAFADGAGYDFLNNQTMYAQWTAQTFTVTFNTGGGSSVSAGSFTTGGGLTLPAAPNLTGFSFTGWFDAASGGTLVGQPGASFTPGVISNVTLYAQWAAAPSPSGNSGSDSALGTTGANLAPMLGAAATLGALGIAFALMARRRRES